MGIEASQVEIQQAVSSCWEAHSHGSEDAERPVIEEFEHLYTTYSPRVYSLCLRMTGNTDEAEDLTQETFLRLFQKLDTFRGESAFYTWLRRLAVNVVLLRFQCILAQGDFSGRTRGVGPGCRLPAQKTVRNA